MAEAGKTQEEGTGRGGEIRRHKIWRQLAPRQLLCLLLRTCISFISCASMTLFIVTVDMLKGSKRTARLKERRNLAERANKCCDEGGCGPCVALGNDASTLPHIPGFNFGAFQKSTSKLRVYYAILSTNRQLQYKSYQQGNGDVLRVIRSRNKNNFAHKQKGKAERARRHVAASALPQTTSFGISGRRAVSLQQRQSPKRTKKALASYIVRGNIWTKGAYLWVIWSFVFAFAKRV